MNWFRKSINKIRGRDHIPTYSEYKDYKLEDWKRYFDGIKNLDYTLPVIFKNISTESSPSITGAIIESSNFRSILEWILSNKIDAKIISGNYGILLTYLYNYDVSDSDLDNIFNWAILLNNTSFINLIISKILDTSTHSDQSSNNLSKKTQWATDKFLELVNSNYEGLDTYHISYYILNNKRDMGKEVFEAISKLDIGQNLMEMLIRHPYVPEDVLDYLYKNRIVYKENLLYGTNLPEHLIRQFYKQDNPGSHYYIHPDDLKYIAQKNCPSDILDAITSRWIRVNITNYDVYMDRSGKMIISGFNGISSHKNCSSQTATKIFEYIQKVTTSNSRQTSTSYDIAYQLTSSVLPLVVSNKNLKLEDLHKMSDAVEKMPLSSPDIKALIFVNSLESVNENEENYIYILENYEKIFRMLKERYKELKFTEYTNIIVPLKAMDSLFDKMVQKKVPPLDYSSLYDLADYIISIGGSSAFELDGSWRNSKNVSYEECQKKLNDITSKLNVLLYKKNNLKLISDRIKKLDSEKKSKHLLIRLRNVIEKYDKSQAV